MTADAVREAVGVETIGIGLGGVELARTWFESICSLYAEVFSVPPFAWDEQEPVRHRQMLERLLTEPSFGLTVEPEAEATQAFYQHLSWQRMGRKRTSPGSAISYFDAYVLPLRAQTRP